MKPTTPDAYEEDWWYIKSKGYNRTHKKSNVKRPRPERTHTDRQRRKLKPSSERDD